MTLMRTTTAMAVVLALVLAGCGGKEEGGAPAPQPPPAASGGDHEEVMKSMVAVFGDYAATLATVKDKATAQAAKPKLQGLVLRMQAVQNRMAALGEPSEAEKQRLKEKYEAAMAEAMQKMMAETMRVAMTPGANEALREVFESMQPASGAKETAGPAPATPPLPPLPPGVTPPGDAPKAR